MPTNLHPDVDATAALGDIAGRVDEVLSLTFDPADPIGASDESPADERNVLIEWQGGALLVTLIDRSADAGQPHMEVRIAQLCDHDDGAGGRTPVLVPQGVLATELTRPAMYQLGEGTAGMVSPVTVKGHPAAHIVALETLAPAKEEEAT